MRYSNTYLGWAGVFLAFLLTTLPACTYFQKKPDLRVYALQEEVRLARKSNLATQNAVKEIYRQLQTLDSKVDDIKKGGEESTPQLQQDLQKITTRSATTQQAVEDVDLRLRALETKVDRHDTALQLLASRPKPPATTVKMEPRTATPAPEKTAPTVKKKQETAPTDESVQREYDKAYAAYTEYRYDEALKLFKSFLERYPKHKLADNAQYWLGEIYYDMGDYANAILVFRDVVTHYTDDDKAPGALLKIGYAYVALGDPGNARMFLKRLIKKYPFSAAEAKARAKLKELEDQ